MYRDGEYVRDLERSGETKNRQPNNEFTLTPSQESACESTIIFMFDQPHHSITKTDFGHYIRETLNIDSKDWTAITKELVLNRQILTVSKSDPSLHRADTFTLNIPKLTESAGEDIPSYLTPNIVAKAKEDRQRYIDEKNEKTVNQLGETAVTVIKPNAPSVNLHNASH